MNDKTPISENCLSEFLFILKPAFVLNPNYKVEIGLNAVLYEYCLIELFEHR
jgi:hypothetical protein